VNVAFLSDIHANFHALSAVAEELARLRPDRVYHLGDIAGYNARPQECIRWAMANTAGGVCGNHDAVACGRSGGEDFHEAALRAALWSRDRIEAACREYLARLPVRLSVEGVGLLVHGSPGDPGRYVFTALQAEEEMSALPALPGQGPVFFGHTHVAGGFLQSPGEAAVFVPPGTLKLRSGDRAMLNPGSVGQPRDRNRDASFLLFDTVSREATWVRVPYDVEAARREVLAAGLPPEFAERLQYGV
jgi:diadenosine tetraphosphatase ApaH/serine/threonine PP2A family protein phosphatase